MAFRRNLLSLKINVEVEITESTSREMMKQVLACVKPTTAQYQQIYRL